ncbi:hypothetical protein ASC78_18335 [Variovorax sp. Root318D1]|nr:hypothetical protein ASC78_18335 [Variovorax sp. Root318D1]
MHHLGEWSVEDEKRQVHIVPDSENRAISLVLWLFAQCKSSCGFVQVLSSLTGYDRSHKKEKNFQRMEI